MPGMLPGETSERLAKQSFLLEEFLIAEAKAGKLDLALNPVDQNKVMLHGHCHQKAFDTMGAVESALKLIPDLEVETIESSCCGMAGSFGYEADNQDISMSMGEMSLFPAVRQADGNTVVVADGTSCRHQILDGTDRTAIHVARVLDGALGNGGRE